MGVMKTESSCQLQDGVAVRRCLPTRLDRGEEDLEAKGVDSPTLE